MGADRRVAVTGRVEHYRMPATPATPSRPSRPSWSRRLRATLLPARWWSGRAARGGHWTSKHDWLDIAERSAVWVPVKSSLYCWSCGLKLRGVTTVCRWPKQHEWAARREREAAQIAEAP